MPKYRVDVKTFINVTLEADNEQQARKRAEAFVAWTEPTEEFIQDYNDDHEDAPIENATFGIDGESDVEEEFDG